MPPPVPRARWRLLGPGIVVAATGVGSGDLVATLIAGERFGYQLLWAIVLGCLVKATLAKGAGGWHLATGRTIFDGWASLGVWARAYNMTNDAEISAFASKAALREHLKMSQDALASSKTSTSGGTSPGIPLSPPDSLLTQELGQLVVADQYLAPHF